MAKFCIATSKSEMVLSGKKASKCDSRILLVFNAENLRNTTIQGGKVTFKCNNFAVDEEKSADNCRNIFECNIENGMVVIKINPEYKPGVIMPYSENIWCG